MNGQGKIAAPSDCATPCYKTSALEADIPVLWTIVQSEGIAPITYLRNQGGPSKEAPRIL